MNSSELLLKGEKEKEGGIFHGLERWRGFARRGPGVRCLASNGSLGIEFAREGVVHVTAHEGAAKPDRRAPPELSGAEEAWGARAVEAVVEETDRELVVSSGEMRVAVAKRDFSLSFSYAGESLTSAAAPALWNGAAIRLDLELARGDLVYGLGEKTGFLDKRGREYVMWNSDVFQAHNSTLDPLYVSIPFYIGFNARRAYGFFLDNTHRSRFDVGATREDVCSITAPGGLVDYYVIGGPGLPGVLARYTALTGRAPIPPRWSIGNQQSRYGYQSQGEIEEVAREFKERGLPLDAIYLDIDYMDGNRAFTWDEDRFPDPAAMAERLGASGVRTVAIIDPGIKIDSQYAVYREMVSEGLCCKYADGKDYAGEVWPGLTVFPDFLKEEARDWWGSRELGFMRRFGIEGIWHDMNEPAVFNSTSTMDEEVLHGSEGLTHAACHNAYASLENRAAYEAIRAGTGKRPFLLSRAGFAGIQRYAAVWTGDNRSMWEHLEMSLPMLLNMELSGLSFVGADIGGYTCDTSAELLVRWYQLGAFYPLCRNHCEQKARAQEPWSFGEANEAIIREALRLRYALLPELYTAFFQAHCHGTPIMRPLVFDFPLDRAVHSIYDQFLFGDGLMIAPVLRPGVDHRIVYLPEGTWIDYNGGERYLGPQWIVGEAPIERIPMYIRAGHALMTQVPGRNAYDLPSGELRIAISVDPSVPDHRFQLYDDDGESFGYEEGEYYLDGFRAEYDGDALRITRTSEQAGCPNRFKKYRFVLSGLGPWSRIEVDGEAAWPSGDCGPGRLELEVGTGFGRLLVR
jgi:alpha-glucosidase